MIVYHMLLYPYPFNLYKEKPCSIHLVSPACFITNELELYRLNLTLAFSNLPLMS